MKYFSSTPLEPKGLFSGSADLCLRRHPALLRLGIFVAKAPRDEGFFKKSIRPILVLVSAVAFLLPAFAFAAATLSISGNLPGLSANPTNPGAWINGFYNLALMLGGVLAFGAVVYGGVLYAASAGNASKQSEGKEWIWAALTGLLLLAGAWLVLYTINPNLTNINFPTLSGLSTVNTGSGSAGTGGIPTGGKATAATFSPGIAGTAKENAVSASAISYYGTNTSGGPGGGTVSCAWAVNNVLAQAGIAALDSNSVQSMENALTSGRGTSVNASQAQPGDIVIQGQDGHVGICMNAGCTQVLSNSSSNASFTWVSNNTFSGSGSSYPSNVQSRIYQVNH